MLIGVVSDTHCINKYIQLAAEKIKNVDILIHLGDNSSDIEQFKKVFNGEIYVVDGNCDYRGEYPKELIIDVNSKKIFLTHGDLYGVKSGLNNIFYKGKELGADIVLYGHSHIEGIERVEDILIMNPGSTSIPKGKGHSIGFIEIDDSGNIDAKIEYLLK